VLHTLKMLVIAVAGLWLGLAGTYYAVERGEDGGVGTSFLFGAVKAGPWTGWPKSGTRDADPYARALYARNGETPLGITEGLSFLARADSSGAPLNPACDYVLSGAIPPARFWTLSAATPHGKPLPTSSNRNGFTSSELLRRADGGFEIQISASARPGNWLQVNGGQPFLLMLRLYDTALSANAYSVVAQAMPSIVKEHCR
jgi:hypothetical protein